MHWSPILSSASQSIPPQMMSEYSQAGLNGPGFILKYFNMIPMGIWTGFEGLWLLVIGALVVLIRQKKVIFAGLFFVCLAGMLWVAHSALDISRGMVYCFPALFVAIRILAESEQPEDLNNPMSGCLCAILLMASVLRRRQDHHLVAISNAHSTGPLDHRQVNSRLPAKKPGSSEA